MFLRSKYIRMILEGSSDTEDWSNAGLIYSYFKTKNHKTFLSLYSKCQLKQNKILRHKSYYISASWQGNISHFYLV